MSEDYDLGYFEGIRNAMMAFMSAGWLNEEDLNNYRQWIMQELEEAKRLKDGD